MIKQRGNEWPRPCPMTTEKGEVISLLAMPRPFPKLKALDMDAVGADILKAL